MDDFTARDPLLARHVSIETPQIHVQTVRLGSEDITRAIFAQVQDQPLVKSYGWTINDEGLVGVLHLQPDVQLWGLVNYCWPECTTGAEWDAHAPIPLRKHLRAQGHTTEHTHLLYAQRGCLFRDCLIDPGALHGLIYSTAGDHEDEQWKHLYTYGEAYETFWQVHIEDLPQLFLID